MSTANLPLALRSAYLTLHRTSDVAFAEFGVTADQFVLLAALDRSDALTQRELAVRMSSDPSTVRAMLVILERKGYVRRQPHPQDARARTVSLTATGKRKFQALWRASDAIRARMVDSLSLEELRTLIDLLSRVTQSLRIESTTDVFSRV